MATRKHWAALAAGGLALALSACSATGTAEGDGPVELEFWGKTQGQQAQVDLWNELNPDVQVTYVQQGGDVDLTQALQNADAAGNAPDVFEMPRGATVSLLVSGVSQDISEWFTNDDGAFAEGAFDFVHVGDVAVGVPFGTNPTFNAINTATFEAYGFEAPTSWPEAVEQAIVMNEQGGVKSFNFPGEDYSYLRDWASQTGAEWWTADGEGWKVGFTSPESLAAGDLVQEVLDNGLVSNYTYIEWDALMQFFASGQLSQFTTSTWQLPVYEANFAQSVGDWQIASYPTWEDGGDLVSPSYYNAYGIGSGVENPEAAVEFARWLATDPDAVSILADTVDGAAIFPVVADPTPYIDGLLPENFLGDTRADAPAVVELAVESSRSMREGPNQVAAMQELTDWWAKALTGEVTVREVLEHMQEWTIDDLKSKNISVTN